MFKKGDKVSIIGTSGGNTYTGEATVNRCQTRGNNNIYFVPVGGGAEDYALLCDVKKSSCVRVDKLCKKFLTADAKKLIKLGYLNVSITLSSKFKERQEEISFETALPTLLAEKVE